MTDNTGQFIGKVICDEVLGANLCIGRIVYPEDQERSCVIQFLPEGASELMRRRFAIEAMIGFDVSREHQNLVTTLHFGRWEDGRLFLAVDLVQGRAVSELISELQGNFATIRAIADAAIQALLFMHGQGVAHGAVEPENILMGQDGVVRLGNFRHARHISDREGGRNDLRALGALLFFMVSGTPIGDVTPDDIEEHLPLDTPADLILAIVHLLGGAWEGLVKDNAILRDERIFSENFGTTTGLAARQPIWDDDGLSEESLSNAVDTLLDLVTGTVHGVVNKPRRYLTSGLLVVSVLALMVASFALWRAQGDRVAEEVPRYEYRAAGGQYNGFMASPTNSDGTRLASWESIQKQPVIKVVDEQKTRFSDRYSIFIKGLNEEHADIQTESVNVQVSGRDATALVNWFGSPNGCTTDGLIPANTVCRAIVEIPMNTRMSPGPMSPGPMSPGPIDIMFFESGQKSWFGLEEVIIK